MAENSWLALPTTPSRAYCAHLGHVELKLLRPQNRFLSRFQSIANRLDLFAQAFKAFADFIDTVAHSLNKFAGDQTHIFDHRLRCRLDFLPAKPSSMFQIVGCRPQLFSGSLSLLV